VPDLDKPKPTDLTRPKKTHVIEHNPPIFLEELAGAKRHVICLGPDDYGVGDSLTIREAQGASYSGRELTAVITYVSQRLVEHLSVMSIRVVKVTGIVRCPRCGSVDARCAKCAYIGALGIRTACPKCETALACLCGLNVLANGVLEGSIVLPFTPYAPQAIRYKLVCLRCGATEERESPDELTCPQCDGRLVLANR
jgi:DNA-directed RNA polymerase subunit RPC12/RpoP